ncbi:precorrin-2 dehydrogenase/sirohydrochlorin ferrochelatase family protein [Halobellus clavatus]|uniref:precorrin-2 dehydrogenase n=1 Tax=Halobellus clavatus TaxID=660517 RepID=A0A1H3JIM0_9EURY|nr:bifunctional precorrin-2 dehydrogenase/sirohydrochlorin ferrochelatase [Halobellus clavatus]SDY39074.1 precorrin-2 dehydrogenase / sirohydrochlorin ferrochelatase [Halobellus clavatus]
MIPLYHDFTGETVLIFGGGPVGARKARRFAGEARVVVVSPEFADADFGDAELVRARPAPADVALWIDRIEPALVVVATDAQAVNDEVAAAGAERGLLVNHANRSASAGSAADDGADREDVDAADDGTPPAHRDVVVPATVEDGDVRVAISTGGRSPALAKYLRERLESELEGAEAMAALTATLRTELRESGLDPSTRRDAIRAVVRDPMVWKALRTGTSNPRREATRVIRNTAGGDRWTPE